MTRRVLFAVTILCLAAAGAVLLDVAHSDEVTFAFSLPEQAAGAFSARLNEAGHGRIAWLREDA